MKFSVTIDRTKFDRQVKDLLKRVQPAQQEAVLYLAASARKLLWQRAPEFLQNPVPWTLNAFAYSPVDDGGRAAALVFVLEQQAQVPQFAVYGGTRVAGDAGTTAAVPPVPGRDAVLVEHGNLPRGRVSAAISQGARWVRRRPDAPLLLVLPGRERARPEILAAIVPETQYEARFPFEQIVKDAVRAGVTEDRHVLQSKETAPARVRQRHPATRASGAPSRPSPVAGLGNPAWRHR